MTWADVLNLMAWVAMAVFLVIALLVAIEGRVAAAAGIMAIVFSILAMVFWGLS